MKFTESGHVIPSHSSNISTNCIHCNTSIHEYIHDNGSTQKERIFPICFECKEALRKVIEREKKIPFI